MKKNILSVVPQTFKAKKAGEQDTLMYKVFLADDRGDVGYTYTTIECKAGDAVEVDLKVRDGKLLPKLVFLT